MTILPIAGGAEVCMKIAKEPSLSRLYTSIHPMVAIFTDGTSSLKWCAKDRSFFRRPIRTRKSLPIWPWKATVFATDGKSVNNVLGFPGIFRRAVDSRAPRITHEMLFAAVDVLVSQTPAGELLPNPLDKKVHREVACAVAQTAIRQGIARAEYIPCAEE